MVQECKSTMGVVSNFIIQALSNKDITVYGDGTQTRSFCYVDDLVVDFNDEKENLPGPINLKSL